MAILSEMIFAHIIIGDKITSFSPPPSNGWWSFLYTEDILCE